MDVERLMKDKTVEELVVIQKNLQSEMEGKKEELRDMVGRRYRDVIDASTEVRKVRALADQLVANIGQARNTHDVMEARTLSRGQQLSIQRFIALHKLFLLIGDESGDALSDVFSLLLAETIHRHLMSESLSPEMHEVITGLTERLIRNRQQLEADLDEELSELSNPDWVINQLTAIAMLKDCNDLHDLLDSYLSARMKFLQKQLRESISLLTLVSEIKSTFVVVDQLFAQGDLIRAIQAVGVAGYRPALIDCLIGDQSLAFMKMLNSEIEKVNRNQRDRKSSQLLTQRISEKCGSWLNNVCSLAREIVSSICGFYEAPNDIIEFIQALSGILKENWPRICSNTIFYQTLFGNLVIDQFKEIIAAEMKKVEVHLLTKLSLVPSAPYPLFEKRAGKFNPLLGCGFSSALKDTVSSFFDDVQKIRDYCGEYEKYGMDPQLDTIRDSLAESFAAMLCRLSSMNSSTEEPAEILNRTRFCLALLQCDPNVVCQTLNKDGERIAAVNKTLHTAIENALGDFCCQTAEECISDVTLVEMMESCAQPLCALSLGTEWEKADVPEVGAIEIPICISPPIHQCLFRLCRQLGDNSVAHLLSRNVRKRLSNKIAELFAEVLTNVVTSANVVSRTWIQLLFDVRVLYTLFPHENMKKLQPLIEEHIDPFDLSLLASFLTTNIRLAAQRSQLLFSCLLVDILPSKDTQTSITYSKVSDIVPRSEHPQRVPLIPRLDRYPNEEVSKLINANKTPRNKLLSNPQTAGKNGPMFSSLYDKVSGFSFFGN